MSESKFEQDICKGLQDLGALTFKLVGTGESSGLPDRLVIHRDWKGFLEFKGEGGRLRENQRLVMKEAARRGFPALVVSLGMVTQMNGPLGCKQSLHFEDARGLLEACKLLG